MNYNGLNLVNNFLNKLKVRDDENYVGSIFYGSYANGLEHKNSDIDLIIVFKNLDKQYKAYKKYKGIHFEYYERSLESLYKRIDNDINNHNDSSLSIIGYGILLDDNYDFLKELQNFTIKSYKDRWPSDISEMDLKYNLIGIYKSIGYLKDLLINNDPYFNIYYGISLEKIRSFYHEVNGFSKIGTSKVYKIYNNKDIALKEHRNLPNDKFIFLFNNCVLVDMPSDKLRSITVLYEYIIKNYDINFDDIKIELDGREY